ncbi:hypothetical protein AALP_AA5G202700 [Arabis alpina]|uniref:RING-type domain-containing protein n=1 Tax=Arabis alpina TaxID=50452 RepID=A0A087GYA9_ARAAL|nr:hypothetical protein AALP_AA5G202700 [Arabis alpina]
MIKGWRRAFCTSIPKDTNNDDDDDDGVLVTDSSDSQRLRHKSTSKFSFFSSTPSTPRCRTSTAPSPSLPGTPKLTCRTTTTTTSVETTPISSPASFSLLKPKLRFNKTSVNKCGICLQSVKSGQGTAIFTAECSHTFHFPCVTSRAAAEHNRFISCPVCGSSLFPEIRNYNSKPDSQTEIRIREVRTKLLRVYNDDEPLVSSPISPAGFHTILESDENDDELINGDFSGFSVNTPSPFTAKLLNVEVKLSTEAAIVAVGKGYETFSVVMKVKSPPYPTARGSARRSPVDLVTVLDVSGRNPESLKRTMRIVISNLKETDRLSIVAFSSSSKRLLPLRRMTANGRRSARRIVDIISVSGGGVAFAGEGMSVNDALKKAVKVLEDRRQKNPFATVFVLTDRQAHQAHVAHSRIPVQTIWLGAWDHAFPEDAFARSINGYLSLSVQDLGLQLGLVSGSGQGEITSVYSLSGRPAWVGTGSIRLGDMYAEEERAYLVEIKSPVYSSTSATSRSHRIMTVRSRYVDPITQETRSPEDRALLIPSPLTVRSSTNPNISRLRNLHVSTRAVAESRRLIERGNYTGAQRLLTSARALLVQYGLSSSDTCLRGVDAELAGINGRHVAISESPEVLTPTSAWKAAEKLAKVAMMRKHMNRVSDLHGFEDARF